MTAPRPKSPRLPPLETLTLGTLTRTDREDSPSFWDKFGTIRRRKQAAKEAEGIETEGRYAIDSSMYPVANDLPAEHYALNEGDERAIIDPKSYASEPFRDLVRLLIDWINDELAPQRIIVKDLEEDLYDGQVLQKLYEKLTDERLNVSEVSQSTEGQRAKLKIVLGAIDRLVLPPGRDTVESGAKSPKWTVDDVHAKNVIAVIHILVALVRRFRETVWRRLPANLSVELIVAKKMRNGQLKVKRRKETLTGSSGGDWAQEERAGCQGGGSGSDRDAFDTLFDQMPDKLEIVKKSLLTFANKHLLNKLNFEVRDLETDFSDGVYFILLLGVLENFFVPFYEFHLTPKTFEQKVHNVQLVFELMDELEWRKPPMQPESIANGDLKATLRLLYHFFIKYRHCS